MELLTTAVMGLAGLGLGFGLAGSTGNQKLAGWIAATVGFFILEFLGVKL